MFLIAIQPYQYLLPPLKPIFALMYINSFFNKTFITVKK